MSNRTAQNKWEAKNPERVKGYSATYSKKKPTWGFRVEDDLMEWLESQRKNGETNAELLRRLLYQLKNAA